MFLFSTPRCFFRSVDGRLGLRLGPISLEGSLDEKSVLLVYGFLTRRAQGAYRTNVITMVFFSSDTSWTKNTLQNRNGNYNAYS